MPLQDYGSRLASKPCWMDVTFRLVSGQVTCVLGRSGTGKSILLKLLIGLEKPDAGSICLEGHDISTASPQQLNEARKRVGFLFQQSALYDSMTIEENVAFPLRRHTPNFPTPNAATGFTSYWGASEWIGTSTRCRRTSRAACSKRVGLARALALDPTIRHVR